MRSILVSVPPTVHRRSIYNPAGNREIQLHVREVRHRTPEVKYRLRHGALHRGEQVDEKCECCPHDCRDWETASKVFTGG
ncbi:hypothetical protein KQI65_09720 [bacterium]|nr:hypothetical protein [bacterium]